jgi:hypothetical protein
MKNDHRYFLRARDAETGCFCSLEYAKRNPKTTIVQRIKRKRGLH